MYVYIYNYIYTHPKTVGFTDITKSQVLDDSGVTSFSETLIQSVGPQVVYVGSIQHPLTSWIYPP